MKYRMGFVKLAGMLLLMLWFETGLQAQDLSKVADLSGRWRFSIGDRPEWASSDYNDAHWEKIWVPKSWEEQGFHGYDGYAWYRTSVQLVEINEKQSYYLKLGYIDDVDEVYINGKKIGSTGTFPPRYTTAFNAQRVYAIPSMFIHKNKTMTIAVRVFDEGGEGGIVHGEIAIFVDNSSVFTDFDLQGDWKFKTGNCSGLPASDQYHAWDEIPEHGKTRDIKTTTE